MNTEQQPLLIGNWKLNHTRNSAHEFFHRVLPELKAPISVELAIAPVAPMLEMVGRLIETSPIKLAAQDVYFMDKGAFTGAWSVKHLEELNVKFCIVGHSERRTLFFESDEDVAKKTRALLAGGITPVCCVGETLEEQLAGLTLKVLSRQTEAIAKGLELNGRPLVFAYEPVWAIGTGLCASKEQAQEAQSFIRAELAQFLGKKAAQTVRILYGGSVTAQNIKEFVKMPAVDGALVGGASLQVESFLSMVKELRGL